MNPMNTQINPMNKDNIPSDNWPLKPRGQAPLLWAMNIRVRESNNILHAQVHRVATRVNREGV